MVKVTIIGAASPRFSLDMVKDICLYPGINKNTIVVMHDINIEGLNMITAVASQYATELGVSVEFIAEPDRRTALSEADFVICTALAGGRGLMERNRTLLEQHNYYRGTMVHAPHQQLAFMLELAYDIKAVCPRAILFQCANPLPEITTLAYRETGIEIIGICHGAYEYRSLAAMLRMDPNKVSCTSVGINHNIWALEFLYDREDVYPKLREWALRYPEDFYSFWPGQGPDYQTSKVTWDLLRLYGYLPIGDTCRTSNPETWWYHVDQETQQRYYGNTGGRDSSVGLNNTLQWLAGTREEIQRLAQLASGVAEALGQERSQWQVVPIIDSILHNRCRTLQVNIPNRGHIIKGLPEDLFVEVPATVNANGVQPMSQYTMPESVFLGHIVPRWLYVERIITAFQTHDIRLLLQAFLADNKSRSYEQAARALVALCEAEWNKEMAEHYAATLRYIQ